MAFLLACEDHRDNGTMGMTFDKPEETIRQGIDCLGQVDELKMFHQTQIPENEVSVKSIDRRKSKKGCRPHRSFTRSTYYADHYLHLLIKKENNKICLRLGFDWSNSVELTFNGLMEKEESNKKASKAKKKGINESMILECLKFAHNNSLDQNINIKSLDHLYEVLEKQCGASQSYYFIRWDKSKLHKYFIEHFSNAQFVKCDGPEWWDEITKFFMDIHYRTERKSVIEKNSKLQSIKKEAFEIKIEKKTLTLPVEKQWDRLHKDWKEKRNQNPKLSLKDFLKDHLIFKNQKYHQHQKVRKMFSLPVPTKGGHTLQKRTSWNKKPIYQIWSDSNSKKDGNKFSSFAINRTKGELKKVINKPFRSKKQFKLNLNTKDTKDFFLEKDHIKHIPDSWININLDDHKELKSFVKKLEYQIDDVTRPKIKLTFISSLTKENKNKLLKAIRGNPLTQPRDDKKENSKDVQKLRDGLAKNNQPIEYTGSSLNKEVKRVLLQAVLKNDNSLK